MIAKYGNWREYQEAVAEVFRTLGCRAEVDKTISGAHGTHDIDVYVTFEEFGLPVCWVVECKLWSTPVDKSEVLTLQRIVQNVGADRGLIFSECGFQSGAHTAVQNTNVLLQSSLEDFSRTAHLEMSRSPLSVEPSDEADALPVHAFAGGLQPHHLLKYDGRLIVTNWGVPQRGNIAIVNPEARAIEGIIELDKYEQLQSPGGPREVRQHPPGNIACADGKIFVGQVFSEFVLVIDIQTQSIIKRIPIPGGGEGAIAAAPDERHIYFASNKIPSFFIIDSATYTYTQVDYPQGGHGCLCVLPHPTEALLYIGIQRGGANNGVSLPGGNSFLAVYDLSQERYISSLYLAEVKSGISDDSTPVCLTYDSGTSCLFIGMFQSLKGICRVNEFGGKIEAELRFSPNQHNRHFPWVDPLSQEIYGNKLVTVNRNNCELVIVDKFSGQSEKSFYLGDAPNGPHSVVIFGDMAVISYPHRNGLIFLNLTT